MSCVRISPTVNDSSEPADPLGQSSVTKIARDENTLDHEFDTLCVGIWGLPEFLTTVIVRQNSKSVWE